MKFSPDGHEIAAISTDPMPQIIVWDISEACLQGAPDVPTCIWEHSLNGFPTNPAGWLLATSSMQRQSRLA